MSCELPQPLLPAAPVHVAASRRRQLSSFVLRKQQRAPAPKHSVAEGGYRLRGGLLAQYTGGEVLPVGPFNRPHEILRSLEHRFLHTFIRVTSPGQL
ncbi:hypothetical protein D3C71_1909430 [compost metagenome]